MKVLLIWGFYLGILFSKYRRYKGFARFVGMLWVCARTNCTFLHIRVHIKIQIYMLKLE